MDTFQKHNNNIWTQKHEKEKINISAGKYHSKKITVVTVILEKGTLKQKALLEVKRITK